MGNDEKMVDCVAAVLADCDYLTTLLAHKIGVSRIGADIARSFSWNKYDGLDEKERKEALLFFCNSMKEHVEELLVLLNE